MDRIGSWRSWLILAGVTIVLFVFGWLLSGGKDSPMGKNKKKR